VQSQVTAMTRSGRLGDMKRFLRSIRTDLAKVLAQQQQAALLQVLRGRVATLTFDELRQILASPIGKGLGGTRIAELLEGPTAPTAKATPRKKSKGTARPKKATKERAARRRKSTPSASTSSTKSTVPADVAAQPRPRKMSAKKAQELEQRTAAVLNVITRAGGWILSREIHRQVAGTPDQVRDALNKLRTGGQVERRGLNDKTEYRVAAVK
jgi:hypothetical protein